MYLCFTCEHGLIFSVDQFQFFYPITSSFGMAPPVGGRQEQLVKLSGYSTYLSSKWQCYLYWTSFRRRLQCTRRMTSRCLCIYSFSFWLCLKLSSDRSSSPGRKWCQWFGRTDWLPAAS